MNNGVPFEDVSKALFRYGEITGSNKDDALLSAFMLLLESKSLFSFSFRIYYSNCIKSIREALN